MTSATREPAAWLTNVLVADGFEGTWNELSPLDIPGKAAFFVSSNLEALRAVREHRLSHNKELLLASETRLDPVMSEQLVGAGFKVLHGDETVLGDSQRTKQSEPSRIWLLTSGSTGRPKRVAHTMESLLTVRGSQPPRRWLNPYTPGSYAWWQVTSLALSHPDTGMVCVDPTESWAEVAYEHDINAASGTPTFWRNALLTQGEELSKINFRQITLGGEPVDQAILDQLAALFPEARISWIYASSEAGASIAVHDGKAGFPVTWLHSVSSTSDASENRPRLRVVDHELLISSPYRGTGIPEELPTGDRAEIRGDRVHIVGRLGSDEVNVGGTKVSVTRVRDVLTAHPGVAWANVRGRKAPIVGNIIQAEVVLDDTSLTETDIIRYSSTRLAPTEIPRRVRILDKIPLRESLKSDV